MEVIAGGRNRHVVNTVECANCREIKREVNHWWMVEVIDGLFTCEPLGDKLWSVEKDAKPVCGTYCAQKEFERFLSMRRL